MIVWNEVVIWKVKHRLNHHLAPPPEHDSRWTKETDVEPIKEKAKESARKCNRLKQLS